MDWIFYFFDSKHNLIIEYLNYFCGIEKSSPVLTAWKSAQFQMNTWGIMHYCIKMVLVMTLQYTSKA